MRNSIAIFDINAKDGIVARASFRRENPERIVTYKIPCPPREPSQCSLMTMLSYCLESVRSAAESNPTLKGRYTFIVPESIAYRMFQAQGCVNRGTPIVDNLFLPWMDSDEFIIEDEIENEDGKTETVQFNAWKASIEGLASLLEEMLDKKSGWSINFVNARTLYRWELIGGEDENGESILRNGMTVDLKNGTNDDGTIVCRENNYLTGTFTVSENIVRDRNQHETPHYYVQRMVPVINKETSQRTSMSVGDYMQLSEEDKEKIEPAYENGVLLINAAKLRTETAKLLPRVKIAKVMTATVATEGGIQF
jgi:hypothetical protein